MSALLLATTALAASSLVGAAKVCTNVTVPVNINARQAVFDVPELQSNLDATRFALNFTKNGANFTEMSTTGYQNVMGTYNISAKYCMPEGDTCQNPTVQILTHGIGFDKSYWDIPFNNYNYSYIDTAIASGFHTVSIDRFGIGNSSHADPLNIVQAPAEVSALYEITTMLREGTFPEVSTKFEKTVHVGHSFGSAQTYVLSAMYPNVTDGVVLTGFSMNATWLPQTLADWNLHLARLNQPLRFGNQTLKMSGAHGNWHGHAQGQAQEQARGDIVQAIDSALASLGYEASASDIWEEIATTEIGDIINGWNMTEVPQNLPNGYLTWTDLTSNIFAFLYPEYFDLGLAVFAEQTKQPVTLGEIFTLANGAPKMSPFTGPVQVVTGQNDNIYCGGDCLATGGVGASIPAAVSANFPDASAFEAYIQPNTGHGINFHYNSTGAYGVIQNWLLSNNLGSA